MCQARSISLGKIAEKIYASARTTIKGFIFCILALAATQLTSQSAPLIFAPDGQFGSGDFQAVNVVAADLNHDGNLDLVVANDDGSCYLGVLLGNGDGTFKNAVKYFSGGNDCLSVAIGDLNNDGIPDIAVANFQDFSILSQGSVSVLLGNGDGTFKTATTYYPGGDETNFVSIADVNGDGKPDLIVTNNCSDDCASNGGVGVLFGNGDGTFQTVATYSTGGSKASAVAVADINGDGSPDLIVTNPCLSPNPCTVGQVAVLLNNGNGTFGSPVTYKSGGMGAYRLVVADINGDSNLDVLVVNECTVNSCTGDGTVGILLGNGNGTLQAVTSLDAGGPGANNIGLADLNGDGKLDMFVNHGCENFSDCAIGTVSVFNGNGDGTFQSPVSYDINAATPQTEVAGDFNGDGKVDLVATGLCATKTTCSEGGVVNVLLNNQGQPTTTTTVSASLSPVRLTQKVTYTATITKQGGGTVSGSVAFKDNGGVIAFVVVSDNQASFTTSYKTIASHSITATYEGEFKVAEGSISGMLTENVVGETVTTITTSGSPSTVGQSVTFSATVSSKYGTIPDGEEINFLDGTKVLASVPLSNGTASFTTSLLTVNTHSIQANYPGDTKFGTSHSAVQQVIEAYATTTTLTSSPNPSTVGEAVVLTATVTSAAPGGATGTVAFKNGTTALGSAKVMSGKATFTTKKLPAGTLTITANYNGDAQSGKSSGTTTQTVQ